MNNLERWFAQRMISGDRNNTLAKYGFMLQDSGFKPAEIETMLLAFNDKLENKLDEQEILSTIMTSIRNRQI